MRIALTIAVIALIASSAQADLARKCCRDLGLGCPTPAPIVTQTPEPPPTSCRKMTSEPHGFHEDTTGVVNPSQDKEDCWTFTVPATGAIASFVEVSSKNTSNTSCGSYSLRLVSPSLKLLAPSRGVQPGMSTADVERGTWRVFLRTLSECPPWGLKVTARY